MNYSDSSHCQREKNVFLEVELLKRSINAREKESKRVGEKHKKGLGVGGCFAGQWSDGGEAFSM